MTSRSVLPSPSPWRVGIRIETSEACSSFTRITAHRIAQPPKAAFVARLRPIRLPRQAARQLPDSSTSIRVGPSSTRETRRQGAHRDGLPNPQLKPLSSQHIARGSRWPASPDSSSPAFPIMSRERGDREPQRGVKDRQWSSASSQFGREREEESFPVVSTVRGRGGSKFVSFVLPAPRGRCSRNAFQSTEDLR